MSAISSNFSANLTIQQDSINSASSASAVISPVDAQTNSVSLSTLATSTFSQRKEADTEECKSNIDTEAMIRMRQAQIVGDYNPDFADIPDGLPRTSPVTITMAPSDTDSEEEVRRRRAQIVGDYNPDFADIPDGLPRTSPYKGF